MVSCRGRVVGVSVGGRPFSGILVPVPGANGTSSDWYCGLAGRGRGAGKGAAGHGTEAATRRNKKTDGPDSGCSLWFVLCCCNHEKKR